MDLCRVSTYSTQILDASDTELRRGTYHEDPGQAEVGHLADVVLAHQDVPGRQIPVDVVLQLQVGHAGRHLGRHLHLVG